MDEQRIRKRLEAGRDSVTTLRREMLEQHGEGPEVQGVGELTSYDQHDADTATETFEREKDESIAERLDAELADIERALAKLDDGAYGTCEACGQPIDEARLEANPEARFCVRDQAGAESEVGRGPGP